MLGLLLPGSAAAQSPSSGLQAAQLAVVINDSEPNSVEIGEYYRQARDIPAKNMVHVRIPDRPHKLDVEQFRQLKAQIDAQLGPEIQAVLMVWTAPYAVECNSITSAFTLGYDAEQCLKLCGPGKPSAYFNASSARPQADFGMRLSMLMPTESVTQAKALIDRAVASGFRTPTASAYYLTTSETPRNSRAPFFPRAGQVPQRKLTIKHLSADSLDGARDIMVYQTGTARVAKLETLRFLPGALADHLTSTGGDLLSNGQMSSLRWLEAGATASYGTVTEPCNYWQKFPNSTVLLQHYLSGASALEAYWRSVAWPAQGVFIGEPLAAPYHR
ncbi:TIGR03790 family protein [Janthinobacterium sp.]|uniref:TIGR03790 family protein n=1 Tax=Janthinobacterium sp. TaxID=1871054 RepID=UPI003977C9A8